MNDETINGLGPCALVLKQGASERNGQICETTLAFAHQGKKPPVCSDRYLSEEEHRGRGVQEGYKCQEISERNVNLLPHLLVPHNSITY
jgi:hypothetical protein